MMNVALLTKNFNRNEKDAAVTTILKMAQFLKKEGHNAVIISEQGFKNYRGYQMNNKHEIIEGIEVFRPYWIPWFRTERWFLDPTILINRILARAMGAAYVEKKKKIKFDIIHGFGAAPIFVLATVFSKIFCGSAHIRTVYTVKAISAHQAGIQVFRKLLKIMDAITVPLVSIRQELVKSGIARQKIHFLHSFIDFTKFHPKNKARLRRHYHRDDKSCILYFGPLGQHKGTPYLLKAIPQIKAGIPDIRIILAHPAYFTRSQKQYISQFDTGHCIELIEKNIKIEDYINMADIVVLPYTTLAATEANPLCLLESMACKTAVVTTDLPELREIVQPDVDVIMAEPKNADSLAENIIKLLNHPSLQKKLAGNAFKTVQKFDIAKIAPQYLRLYRSLREHGRYS